MNGLAASGTSSESVALTAPSTAGTYYYGACVDAVVRESDTNNNCSASVQVTVLDLMDRLETTLAVGSLACAREATVNGPHHGQSFSKTVH